MTGCHKGGALNPPRRTGADQSGLIIAHLPQCCHLPEVVDTSGEPFISRRGISPLKTTHLSRRPPASPQQSSRNIWCRCPRITVTTHYLVYSGVVAEWSTIFVSTHRRSNLCRQSACWGLLVSVGTLTGDELRGPCEPKLERSITGIDGVLANITPSGTRVSFDTKKYQVSWYIHAQVSGSVSLHDRPEMYQYY